MESSYVWGYSNMANKEKVPETIEHRERSPRSNQKLKIMYLMKILMEETDENHAITLQEIVEHLKAYGVTAERKSLYSDIENLRIFGLDIEGYQMDRTFYYQVVNRDFQLPELKLLVDAVQASKFITEKESKELIKRLEAYASKFQAAQMHRQVYVNGRVKSRNEKNYYSVDNVYTAIETDRQISFQYYHYDVNKKEVLAHDGKVYKVSPWAMCWDDEKYYMVAYDEEAGKIKHYRVDKMLKTKVLEDERVGKSEFKKENMSQYTHRLFGMFDGELKRVELLCDNSLANVIFDRFGLDTRVEKVDDEHFIARVEVAVSSIFFGWIMALEMVRVIGPDDVVDQIKKQILGQYDMYFGRESL